MKDKTIRSLLRGTELKHYIQDSNSRVVEELKLPVAGARVDIAVVNGHLHAYEIKGASDTLQRLPSQIIAYSKVFDYITVVTEEKYYQRILEFTPPWVGVSIFNDDGDYSVVQPPTINVEKEGFFISKLLWNSEIHEILNEQGIPFNKKARQWILCEQLSDSLPLHVLSELVRGKLKARKDWKITKDYI